MGRNVHARRSVNDSEAAQLLMHKLWTGAELEPLANYASKLLILLRL